MSVIHSKHTPDGIRFRMWSTISDRYITDELTEEEVRKYTLEEALRIATENHNREIERRINQAISNGTSSMIGNSRDPNAEWDKPFNP